MSDYPRPATLPVSANFDFTKGDAVAEMERRWGSDYPRRIALVQSAVGKLGDGFRSYLDASGRGNEPATLETLYRYASGDLTIDKTTAQKRLDKIHQDPKHPYWNKNLPSHEARRHAAEVKFLNAVIREDERPERASDKKLSTQYSPSRGASTSEKAKSDARAEASEIVRSGVLMKGSAQERDAATQRFITLTAVIARS